MFTYRPWLSHYLANFSHNTYVLYRLTQQITQHQNGNLEELRQYCASYMILLMYQMREIYHVMAPFPIILMLQYYITINM